MKKAVFFIVLLLIGYMAGMYGNAALMVLFLSQLMIAAVMFCLSRYMTARLEISFFEKTIFAEKEVPFPIHIRAVNRGRLPVARFILLIEESSARWKRKVKNRIPGECGEGENLLAAETLVSDCGIVTFHITEIRVYDYLSLFFGRKRADLLCQAVVFPKDRALSIELGTYPGGNDEDMTMPFSEHGNSHDEVRQIREYRAGDPVRHIHWNQTAKSGNLWVKEYEDERKPVITLYLDREELVSGSAEADTFYELLQAVLAGLIRSGAEADVSWRDRKNGKLYQVPAGSREQIWGILLELFRLEEQEKAAKTAGSERQEQNISEDGRKSSSSFTDSGSWDMRLTAGLCWFGRDRLIRKFNVSELDSQMEESFFL